MLPVNKINFNNLILHTSESLKKQRDKNVYHFYDTTAISFWCWNDLA